MRIPTDSIKELRGQSGAGVMACRNALLEAEGDMHKATEILKQHSLYQAEKKADRVTSQGLIESYIHTAGRIGAIVELNCETDFVARTDEFKELAHNLAMQIAALSPQYITKEELAEDDTQSGNICLLMQPYIKDPSRNVVDVINETIAKVGENIRVRRFSRFELGR